jgi:HlyD family secretion protein
MNKHFIKLCILLSLFCAVITPVYAEDVVLKPQTLKQSLKFKGRLMPATLIAVTAPAAGIVQSMPVKFGQAVSQNQLLFQLVSSQLPNTHEEAKQRLATAKSRLEELEQWNYQVEAQQLQYQITRSKSEVTRISARFNQTQKLFEAGIISKEECLQEQRMLEDAKQNHRYLELMFSKLKQSSEGRLYQDAQRALKIAEAEVYAIEAQLQALTLHASEPGILLPPANAKGDLPTSTLVGQSINAGDVLGYLGSTYRWTVELMIDETEMQNLTEQQSVTVTLPAVPSAIISGKVTQINRNQLKASNTNFTQYPVTIELDPLPDVLKKQVWFGMSAHVSADFEKADTLIVPKTAIRIDKEGAWVMLKKAGKQVPTAIQLGKITWDEAEILNGLEEGDTLVAPYPTTGA